MFKWAILIGVLFNGLLSSYSQQNSFPFIWIGDSINGNYFEKTALFIPVEINRDSTTYYFQFDTGSNKSFLYKGTNRLAVNNENILDTDLGEIELLLSNSNYAFTINGCRVIGTLGADFIQGKIIEIDYLEQKINILDTYDISNYNLQSISLSYGRPVIEISINNKKYPLLFDTGSSIFEVWTTKRLWNKWRNKAYSCKEFSISSWGKINTSYQSIYRNTIYLADNSISINQLWYNSNKHFNKVFKQAKVNGLIGNKPFYSSVILIDLKNNSFGVKKTTKIP